MTAESVREESGDHMSTAGAGWYPDPHERDQERWWTGQQWTTDTRLVAVNETSGWSIASLVVAIAVFVGAGSFPVTLEELADQAADREDFGVVAIGAVMAAVVVTGVVFLMANKGSSEARRKRVGGAGLATASRVLAVLSVVAVGAYAAVRYVDLADQVEARADDYPALVRGNFLVSCESTGADPDDCGCALEAVEAEVSLRRFQRFEQDFLETGQFPPELADAFRRSC